MKLDSYWLDTAPACRSVSEGPVEGNVDVAVIGGGFTGLSAALALAKRGASVAVLDAGRMGGGASGRNGGQCNTGVAQDYVALYAQLGAERARGCYRAYASAVETVERLIRDEQIDCDYLASGKLKLAAKPHHLEHLEKTAELIRREVDPDIELIGRDRIRSEVGSDSFYGGLLQKHGGQMHMGKFAVGLANAAARNGARLFENASVTSIEKDGGAYRIVSARGELRAKQVLIATGPSRHGPFGWYRRRLAPVGSFIVVTEPLPAAELARLLPERRSYTTSRLMHNYFRVTPDARLLFGGRARFTASEQPSDAKSGRILQANLVQMFPTSRRCAHRLLLGRSRRYHRRPVAARRPARRHLFFDGLQRPRHADVDAHGPGNGRRDRRQRGGEPVARIRLARDSRTYRQALVPAARGHVLPHQRCLLLNA